MSSPRARLDYAWAGLCTLAVTWPFLIPGALLSRDLVGVSRVRLDADAWGLGAAAPRAVPQDAVLGLLTAVVDGALLVRLAVWASLLAAGLGAARLAASVLPCSLSARWAAITVAILNPWTVERLLQGHWSLLTGYAALPWVMLAVARRRWGALALAVAAAAFTPSGGLLAATVSLVTALVVWPGIRPSAQGALDPRKGRGLPGLRGPAPSLALLLILLLVLLLLANAPWIITGLLWSGGTTPSPEGVSAGVSAFAPRSEGMLGTILTLATLGGLWNSDAVPVWRESPLAFLGVVGMAVIAGAGTRALLGHRATRRMEHRPRLTTAALVLALFGGGTAFLATTPLGHEALTAIILHVPGAGVVRDSHKALALTFPLWALLTGAGAHRLSELGHRVGVSRSFAGAGTVVLVLLLVPDAPAAVSRDLRGIDLPEDWSAAAHIIDDTGPGAVLVAPAGQFRVADYAPGRPFLDPAPRILPGEVLVPDSLVVGGTVVAAENSRAAELQQRLLDEGLTAEHLAAAGVRWVLIEYSTTAPGPRGTETRRRALAESSGVRRTVAGLESRLKGSALGLWEVPEALWRRDAPRTRRAPSAGSLVASVGAHLAWAVVMLGGASAAAARAAGGGAGPAAPGGGGGRRRARRQRRPAPR